MSTFFIFMEVNDWNSMDLNEFEIDMWYLTLRWSKILANVSGQGVLPPFLNLNHSLSDLLFIVELWTYPSSTRIQIKNCQYL